MTKLDKWEAAEKWLRRQHNWGWFNIHLRMLLRKAFVAGVRWQKKRDSEGRERG